MIIDNAIKKKVIIAMTISVGFIGWEFRFGDYAITSVENPVKLGTSVSLPRIFLAYTQ